MKIVIAGLGIIGGSLAKAIKNTPTTPLSASTAVRSLLRRRLPAVP